MAVKIHIDPIDEDVKLIFNELLSPEALSRMFAADAQVRLDEADDTNLQVLGRIPYSKTFVNGTEGAALASVTVPGVIVREYELVIDLLIFIANELRQISPVGSGRDKHPGFYRGSHTLFADGMEVPIGENIPDAKEYVFLSDVPYARKIEGQAGRAPQSPMAPKGVYEITAIKANREYGDVAKVAFQWRSPFLAYGGAPSRHSKKNGKWSGGQEWETRVPAIIVILG